MALKYNIVKSDIFPLEVKLPEHKANALPKSNVEIYFQNLSKSQKSYYDLHLISLYATAVGWKQ
jgi:hypothetical protein